MGTAHSHKDAVTLPKATRLDIGRSVIAKEGRRHLRNPAQATCADTATYRVHLPAYWPPVDDIQRHPDEFPEPLPLDWWMN